MEVHDEARLRGAPRARLRSRSWQALTRGGPEGNEQLTTIAGAILIVLLAVIGVTIIRIGQLLWLHLFIGLLLLGPVAVKMASTGYRFVRYYTRNPIYRAKGPPEPTLRAIAPIVVASTLIVFATGIVLLIVGPAGRQQWVLIHKVAFIVWIVFTALHVLSHLPLLVRWVRMPGLSAGAHGMALDGSEAFARLMSQARLGAEWHSIPGSGSAEGLGTPPGAAGRWLLLGGGLAVGLVIAVALIPEFATWTAHTAALHHHH